MRIVLNLSLISTLAATLMGCAQTEMSSRGHSMVMQPLVIVSE
jgi:hypothetical protein